MSAPDCPPWLQQLIDTFDPAGESRKSKVSATAPAAAPAELPSDDVRVKRARAYLATMPPAIQGQNGSGATYAAACAVVHGFALGPDVGLRLLLDDYNPRCEPAWSEDELAHKVRDAAAKTHREPAGYLLSRGDLAGQAADWVESQTAARKPAPSPAPAPSAVPVSSSVGQPDAAVPTFEFLNEADDDPHRIARGFLARYAHQGHGTLVFWRDEFYEWAGSHWSAVPRSELEAEVNGSARRHFEALQREYQRAANAGQLDELPRMGKVTCGLVGNVAAALRQLTLLRGVDSPPAWIRGGSGPSPKEIVPARNGLVHLPAFVEKGMAGVLANDPRYFNTNAVGFPVTADAAPPAAWLRFLAELWPDDPESVALLQEWFGYLLTPDTAQQKMLLLIGPRRSGKGTISRVLQSLVGPANCCGPTLSGLAGPFGLAPLLGKSVAVIEDARLSGRADAAVVVERMLAISGEGTLTVERKHLDAVNVRLATRFVVSTNEIPRLPDVSGALASRWCVLRFFHSFEGKEDTALPDRLLAELPGIFLWAVKGWERLHERKRFTRPAESDDIIETIAESGSPLGRFIEERCELWKDNTDPPDAFEVKTKDLYAAWCEHCERTGRKEPGTEEEFGRQFRSAAPLAKRKRRTRRVSKSQLDQWYVYDRIRLKGPIPADAGSDDRLYEPAESVRGGDGEEL